VARVTPIPPKEPVALDARRVEIFLL
jgi:hypothetical protein